MKFQGECKRKKLKWIWLMHSLCKNEYRTFKLFENNHKKGTKVERSNREVENPTRWYCINAWKYHKEIPYVAILNNQNLNFLFFSFAKLENRGEKQVLTVWRGFDASGREVEVQNGNERMIMVEKLCTHECKWKKDTCWNNFSNSTMGR
jgi:hypothetical protein